MLSKLEGLMSALEIFANHLSRLSFDNSRVLSPWCSITLGSLKKDLLSLPCLFEQLTIAQKAGMIISAYQSIKIHSGKTFVYTSGLLVCLPIWRTINWWRHTRILYTFTVNTIHWGIISGREQAPVLDLVASTLIKFKCQLKCTWN
jgi:hypothetical protein